MATSLNNWVLPDGQPISMKSIEVALSQPDFLLQARPAKTSPRAHRCVDVALPARDL